MKKLILTSATVLFIGLIAFAYESGKDTKKVDEKNDQKEALTDAISYEKQIKNEHIGSVKWPKDLSLLPRDSPQNLRYDVHGIYSRSITKARLNEAKLISDIISGYPNNWISSYVSVEIMATCNGNAMKAVSLNTTLTAEQKNILNTADMASNVVINVNYLYQVHVTNNIENNTMHVSMTVVPETQAEYVGGYEKLINYLKEKGITKFPETTPKEGQRVIIRFTVNEEGNISDARISETSGDQKTDKLLLDAVNKMPQWKPAENAKGIRVKQEFEFRVGNGNDGC